MMNKKLKFAVIGTGFWANYQIAAWLEIQGVELVALYNRTPAKAEMLAAKYNVPHVYSSVEQLLNAETLDFVDIITDVNSHAPITSAAAEKGVSVICQKPMATSLTVAKKMVSLCTTRNVPLFIHENWRWQAPIREVKRLLRANTIGEVFKARVTFCSAFPVFENQPFLASLDQFILTDIGSHILDVCRFLFGEAESLLCHTTTVNKKIKGEDVATVMMQMNSGVSCIAEMSYASILEREVFPQTLILIEATQGSISLSYDHVIRITTKNGTEVIRSNPKNYQWADPAYALVHASIVDCNQNILNALSGVAPAETTGLDNLETVRLVHAAYASSVHNKFIFMKDFV